MAKRMVPRSILKEENKEVSIINLRAQHLTTADKQITEEVFLSMVKIMMLMEV